jgi:hypothetical protein
LPEGVTHPAIINAREAIALEEQARAHADWALARAVMLSPTLDVCEALLQGEAVPLSKLDHKWFRKYGIRRDAA